MYDNPEARPSFLQTPSAAAMLVIGSLVFLILIRKGFRGVSVGGVSVGVK